MAQAPKTKPAAKAKATPAKKPAAKISAVKKSATASKAVPKKVAVVGTPQSKVKEEASDMKSRASEAARSAAERGKARAAEGMGSIGKIIRDSAASIDDSVGTQYGDYARKAADAVEGFAGKVDEKEVDDLVDGVRDFVRKSPAVAIGAAAAVGFVLVRLLRSGRDET
jgi:ElaB/YqjD/DUF883 family membrane-anchored ribosome-binding protein